MYSEENVKNKEKKKVAEEEEGEDVMCVMEKEKEKGKLEVGIKNEKIKKGKEKGKLATPTCLATWSGVYRFTTAYGAGIRIERSGSSL